MLDFSSRCQLLVRMCMLWELVEEVPACLMVRCTWDIGASDEAWWGVTRNGQANRRLSDHWPLLPVSLSKGKQSIYSNKVTFKGETWYLQSHRLELTDMQTDRHEWTIKTKDLLLTHTSLKNTWLLPILKFSVNNRWTHSRVLNSF